MVKKNNFYFKQTILDYFYFNKVKIIFLSVAIIVGIIIGVLNLANLCKIFDTEEIIEKYIGNFSGQNISAFSFFFKVLLEALIFLGVIFALSLCRYIHPLIYLLFIYIGYLVGYNASLIIIVYGVGGIFNLLIFYIPLQIIYLCFLMFFATISIKNCNDKWNCGKNYVCSSKLSLNVTTVCVFFGLLIAVLIIEALIMPNVLKNILTIV